MPETVHLVDFFLYVNILKEIMRYEEKDRREKFNGDSTAEHTWRVSFMVSRVIDHFSLEVEKDKAVDMAIGHDLLEVITKDRPARSIYKKPWMKQQKRIAEEIALEKILRIIPESYRQVFYDLTIEYWKGESPEAVLVKGVDKNESTLHILSNSTREMVCDGFFPVYGKPEILKMVEVFPQLRPFILDVRRRVRAEVEKYGAPWKKKYDYLGNGNS